MSDVTKLTKKAEIELVEAAANLFTPTKEMKQVKASFYTIYGMAPLCSAADIDLRYALELTGEQKLAKWWQDERFVAWFKNRNVFQQKLEFLAERSVDIMHDLLELGYDKGLDADTALAIKAKTMGNKIKLMELLFKATAKIPEASKTDTNNEDKAKILVEAMLARMTKEERLSLAKKVDDNEQPNNS